MVQLSLAPEVGRPPHPPLDVEVVVQHLQSLNQFLDLFALEPAVVPGCGWALPETLEHLVGDHVSINGAVMCTSPHPSGGAGHEHSGEGF